MSANLSDLILLMQLILLNLVTPSHIKIGDILLFWSERLACAVTELSVHY